MQKGAGYEAKLPFHFCPMKYHKIATIPLISILLMHRGLHYGASNREKSMLKFPYMPLARELPPQKCPQRSTHAKCTRAYCAYLPNTRFATPFEALHVICY
jgi:hypothetical protein